MRIPHATERFLSAAKAAEIRSYEELAETCNVVRTIGHLVHDLQRERGLSNVYLASSGSRLGDLRASQIESSMRSETAVRDLLQSYYLDNRKTSASVRLLTCIAVAVQLLDGLQPLRPSIERLALSPAESTFAFSHLLSALLTLISEAADSAGDPAISRMLVALINFIQGKEYAGQERAWCAIGLASSGFSTELSERIVQLRFAQDRCFDLFLEYAPDHQQSWSQLTGNAEVRDFQRLRTMVDGLGDQVPGDLSEVWYRLATARIDLMHGLEQELTDALLELSTRCLKQARQDLKDHELQLSSLSRSDGSSDRREDMEASLAAMHDSSSLSEEAGSRSLHDLIRSQARHIQKVSDELQETRRTLSERRLMEQAKALLRESMGLTEQEAHQRIQKKAMESNMRLSEVCEILIAAAEKASRKR